MDLGDLDLGGREGARLVEAQHAHPAHRFDGVGALDERLLAGEADDGQGIRHGHHDHQALGDERDEDRRRARGLDRGQAPELAIQADQDRHGRDDHEQGHAPQDAVHVLLERGALGAERPGARGQLVGEAGRADAGRHVARLAIDAEAAREHLRALRLGDAVRLPREQRLVRLEGALRHLAVEQQLVAAADHEQVAQDHLEGVDGALDAIPDDARGRSREHRQPVEAALGADLLEQADHHVDDHQHDGDGGIAVQLEIGQDDADGGQQDVDRLEQVVAEDVDVGPTAGDPRVVAEAACAAGGCLRVGQPGSRRRWQVGR